MNKISVMVNIYFMIIKRSNGKGKVLQFDCPLQSTMSFNYNEVNSANIAHLCSKDNKRSTDHCIAF